MADAKAEQNQSYRYQRGLLRTAASELQNRLEQSNSGRDQSEMRLYVGMYVGGKYSPKYQLFQLVMAEGVGVPAKIEAV